MTIAGNASRVAFEGTKAIRGVEVEYSPNGGGKGHRFKMVPGSSDAEAYGDADVEQSAYTNDWLEFRSEIYGELSRMPIEGDKIRRLDTGQVYEVQPLNEERAWRNSGSHGGVIRIFSLEVNGDG